MATDEKQASHLIESLVLNVRDLLESPDPRARVAGVRQLAMGVDMIEGLVIGEARTALTWAEIGDVYGVSRQAVHRRFADETVLAPDAFDAFLAELDKDDEPSESLIAAARRAASTVKRR